MTEQEWKQLRKDDTIAAGENVCRVIETHNDEAWLEIDGMTILSMDFCKFEPTGDTIARLRPETVEGSRAWAIKQCEEGRKVRHESWAISGYVTSEAKYINRNLTISRYDTGWTLYEDTKPVPSSASLAHDRIEEFHALALDNPMCDTPKFGEMLDSIYVAFRALETRINELEDKAK